MSHGLVSPIYTTRTHDLLDGATHPDTVAVDPQSGDMIVARPSINFDSAVYYADGFQFAGIPIRGVDLGATDIWADGFWAPNVPPLLETSKWDRLAIGPAGSMPRSTGTFIEWVTLAEREEGVWYDVPLAASLISSEGGSFSVDWTHAYTRYRYCLIGDTLHIALNLWGVNVSGAPLRLRVRLPSIGKLPLMDTRQACHLGAGDPNSVYWIEGWPNDLNFKIVRFPGGSLLATHTNVVNGWILAQTTLEVY